MSGRQATLKFAVVDVEATRRQFIHSTLTDYPGLHVVGIFDNSETALESIPALQPDVVLIHIEPSIGVNTVHFAIRLRSALPGLGIVLISDHQIASAISFLPRDQTPGWGFIHKDTVRNPAMLKHTMEASLQRMIVLDPDMVLSVEDVPHSGFVRLTPKQLRTLQLIAEGHTNPAIAKKLDVSVKAVENHINQIYRELEIDRSDRTIHPRIRAVNIYFTQHLSDQSDTV